MRKIAIIAGLAAVIALAVWLWPRDAALETALPASTVSVVLMQQPQAVAQRLDGLTGPMGDQLGAIQRFFVKEQRTSALGFDPTAGFADIGLGKRGAAIARLARLEPPVLCLDLVAPERFAAWITARSGKPTTFDAEALRAAEYVWPVVRRGDWTCISTPKTTTAKLIAAFEDDERLADAPLFADLDRPDALVQSGWSARQATRWAHGVQRTALAADLGHLAAYVRSAIAQLDAGLTVTIHLTPEGQGLADGLFKTGKSASFSRWLALDGWGAARLSLALASAPDALATALPPSAPATQRQAISLGRMALPMTAGINWQQLTTALDGSLAIGVDLRDTSAKPPSLLVLGVKDQAAARKAVEAVAKKFGEGGGLLGLGKAQTAQIGGVSAWRLTFKSGPAWVHLAEGAVVVASSPEVLATALKPRQAEAGWAVLDDEKAVLAVAADMPALRARLPAAAPRTGLDSQTLSLAIRRTPSTLKLRVDGESGVQLDTLVGLGLWTWGQARRAQPAAPVKAPSPSPAKP